MAVGGGAARFGANRFCHVLIRWKFEFGRGMVIWGAYVFFLLRDGNGKDNSDCLA